MQTDPIPFAKMHGLGNDFVVLDLRGGGSAPGPALVRAIADRHTGVGFDQLVTLSSSERADIRLVFWNGDGSQSGACGNATRCVAARIMHETGRDCVTIETSRGVLQARQTEDGPSVNLGAPQLLWSEIPLARELDPLRLPLEASPVAVGPVAVGMGNPHCVFFVDDAGACDPAGLGPQIERNPLFPEGTNVEFASVSAPNRLRMRVWERGAGITRACGSGACATAVAAHLRGLTGRRVWLDLDGGGLLIDWREDGVWMTGPVAHVFDGVLRTDWLERL